MSMTPDLQLDDIQGLVASGYGPLEAGAYLLMHIDDAAAACTWLSGMSALVTTADARPDDRALNIAFTHAGLAALGLDDAALGSFPPELREGMTHPHRARILGDLGESAPQNWRWGGPGTTPVHMALLVFARNDDMLRAAIDEIRDRSERGGVSFIGEPLSTIFLRDPVSGCVKEHFGFCDAIAQPFVPGFSRSGKTDRAENTVLPGEFILGYANEYDRFTELPTVPAARDPEGVLPRGTQTGGAPGLGMNGTYLVFRQLEQHVHRFWEFLADATQAGSVDERIRLAAKMVGRWPGGAPLVRNDRADDPRFARDNAFDYHHADARGLKCPLGSHVRRTNPRDALEPGPGTQRSIDINKRHRLLRRGRAYGPPVHASLDPRNMQLPDDGIERGLHFICVNGNLSRQFEFVQQTWMNNQKFDGLYDDADPVAGNPDPHEQGQLGTFTVQAEPVRRRVTGIPRFVTTRGGAYFFLPGVRALRYLSTLAHITEAQPMVHAQ
jgi:Dyp-type peroxidase family